MLTISIPAPIIEGIFSECDRFSSLEVVIHDPDIFERFAEWWKSL
jgi:hypothetical protein